MYSILFGFKYAGKSYFATKLQIPFIDTDHVIEKREGKTIRDLVFSKGEAYFRQLERQVVEELVSSHKAGENRVHLLAVGGGTLLDPYNLDQLQQVGKFIYLDCPKPILKERFLAFPRPAYCDPKETLDVAFERIYSSRIVEYEKIASLRIDLKGKSDQQVLEKLWQAINLEICLGSLPGENRMEKRLE